MSDHRGYGYPPAAGYGVYMLIRGLIRLVQEPKKLSVPTQTVIAKPPIPTPPPPRPSPPVVADRTPPLVQWTEPGELLAWRCWRLGFLLRGSGGDGGPRLLSLSAPCVWNGPVVRCGVPALDQPSGIYALKADQAGWVDWQNEHVWVVGTIALSGRVVEHEIGFRAERAVVRELHLGVGTHLAVRSLKRLRELVDDLEDHYQVTVHIGGAEREIADRMLHSGRKPQCPTLPFIWDRPPWRII